MAERMQIRLLGPVEAWAGERKVRLDGPRQRVVLAALALDVGRALPLAGLVDAIWSDDPPATAKQQIHSSISALRRVLGAAIVTTSTGYRLSVPAEQVDVHVFEAGVAKARQATKEGRPQQAADLLREALALWAGPALSGMPGLAGQAVRLEERRLTVLEERIDLDLQIGRHVDLVAELAGLVAAHPLRERLVAQLMLALYRSGRRADALEAYRTAKARFAADLGLDLGAELRSLQLAILRADPGLEVPAPAKAPAAALAAPPAQLPPDVAGFTGRADDLSALTAMLPEGEQRAVVVTAITGTAGVGKTALAVHWAHRIRHQYPDGQLHVNLRGYATIAPLRPIDALARFVHALDVPAERVPVEVEEASAMYRSLLAGKRVLVLLDNAHSAEQVRPLLPGSAGCLVMVTSRDQLAGLTALDGAHRLSLDALTPDESAALLGRILDEDRVRAEPEAAADLARLCAFLPLALRIAAANLTCRPGDTIAGYTAKLRAGNRLAALQVEGDPQAAVRAAFDLSYAALSEPARWLFRLLGLVPGPDVTADAAAALADATPVRAGQLLDLLARAHLMERNAPDRYAFHDLLRLYATERCGAEDIAADREAATGRLFDYYLQTTDAAAQLLYPQVQRIPPPEAARQSPVSPTGFGNDTAALAWLDAERPNLLAIARRAADTGPQSVAWRLADTLRGYFWLRMHAVDWLTAAQTGLAAAESDSDARAQAAIQISLGDLHWRRGLRLPAIDHYRRASTLAQRSGWIGGQASASGSLGNVHRHMGQLAQAATHLGQALLMCRGTGALGGQAAALDGLGIVCSELGRLREAANHHAEALALRRELKTRGGEAASLTNLAEVYRWLGSLDPAVEHLDQALILHREFADTGSEAETLRILASVHSDAGRHAEARELARTALDLARESGDRRYEVDALNTLAVTHHRLGHSRSALTCHEQALALARTIGDRYSEAESLIGLAGTHQRLRDLDRARSYATAALALAREAEFRMLEGQSVTALGAIHLAREDVSQAINHVEQALAIHRETGHRLGEAQTHLVLGHALRGTGDIRSAEVHWQRGVALLADIGAADAEEVGDLLGVRWSDPVQE